MEEVQQGDVWEASVRSRGIARYVTAVFLSVWLAGWTAGEWFAGRMLLGFLAKMWNPERVTLSLPSTGQLPVLVVIGFLFIWLFIWTLGGVAAFWVLLRAIAGRDVIRVGHQLVTVTSHAGPFRRTHSCAVQDLVRIDVRKRRRDVRLETVRDTLAVTDLGSDEDRHSLVKALEQRLPLRPRTAVPELPIGWMTGETLQGTTYLQRTPAPVARAVMALMIAMPTAAWVSSGSLAAFLIGPLLLLGAAWVAWAQERWVLGMGSVERERRFLGLSFVRLYAPASLFVEWTRDSDGDERCELRIRSGDKSESVESNLNGDGPVIRLARWLESRGGLPLYLGQRP
jgi:hypothetical protein